MPVYAPQECIDCGGWTTNHYETKRKILTKTRGGLPTYREVKACRCEECHQRKVLRDARESDDKPGPI